MKQQDVAMLIIIVFVAGVLSFFVSNNFITPSSDREPAETVTPIVADFRLPDPDIFNMNAINPTVPIEIAPNTNNQPFAD